MTDTRIGVIGCDGFMGRLHVKLAAEAQGLTVGAALERSGSDAVGKDAGVIAGIGETGVIVTDDMDAFFGACDVAIDFTHHSVTPSLIEPARKHGVKLVVGTSGLSAETEAALEELSKDVAVLYSTSMSPVVNILFGLTKQVAGMLDEDYDIEIIDFHHRRKVDAPSGTTLSLGKLAAEGRGVDHDEAAIYAREGDTGPRPAGGIGYCVLRGGDVVGEHKVMYIGDGERMEIGTITTDRGAYARGSIRAARWLADKQPGRLYHMKDVLGLD